MTNMREAAQAAIEAMEAATRLLEAAGFAMTGTISAPYVAAMDSLRAALHEHQTALRISKCLPRDELIDEITELRARNAELIDERLALRGELRRSVEIADWLARDRRAALAAPEPEPEPVAFNYVHAHAEARKFVQDTFLWKRWIEGTSLSIDIALWMTEFARRYAAPPAPAQQGQPVAWIGPVGQLMPDMIYQPWRDAHPDDARLFRPLFAAPPARTPMTDKQASELITINSDYGHEILGHSLVRAVERHHGIGVE